MTDFSTSLTAMLTAANAGELTLTDTASKKCVEACNAYIAGLDRVIEHAFRAGEITGFGILKSGDDLQKKYASIAVGDDHSLDTVLKQHIEVATRLKAVFEAAGRGYADTEAANASTITGTY